MATVDSIQTSVSPSIYYEDAFAAIEWLSDVFGFRTRLIVKGPNGTLMHSELTFGAAVVMISTERPAQGRLSPRKLGGSSQSLSVFVENVDAHYSHTVERGAVIERPIQDEGYGARGYAAVDLEGHSWYFSNYVPGAYWSDGGPMIVEE